MQSKGKIYFTPALRGMMVVVTAIGLVSCKKEWVPAETKPDEPVSRSQTYTIETGQHSCNGASAGLWQGTSLRFMASFDSSAIYSTAVASNQGDVNKLYGFSDCHSFHHDNSARFGWNWHDNALHIYAYVYSNQVRIIKEITTVALMQPNVYQLAKQDGNYRFTVNDGHQILVQSGCSTPPGGYMLYPYFGGDEAAPHPIRIKLMELP